MPKHEQVTHLPRGTQQNGLRRGVLRLQLRSWRSRKSALSLVQWHLCGCCLGFRETEPVLCCSQAGVQGLTGCLLAARAKIPCAEQSRNNHQGGKQQLCLRVCCAHRCIRNSAHFAQCTVQPAATPLCFLPRSSLSSSAASGRYPSTPFTPNTTGVLSAHLCIRCG